MIRNEKEYQQARDRIDAERARFEEYQTEWKSSGRTEQEVARLIEPLMSFHEQLVEEIESYERLKQGDFGALNNFDGIGRLLVGLRIAAGISQADLAKRLGVSDSAVSRDERNEYHGITVARANRILSALGAVLVTRVDAIDHHSSGQTATVQP